MLGLPVALGVYDAEQLDVLAPVLDSVQVVDGENAPAPFEERLTVPLGGLAEPWPVSVTVAAQVVVAETATAPGVQLTAVVVGRVDTASATAPPLPSQPGVPAAPA
jgi:hypothetical protein